MLIKKDGKNSITCKISREELEARGISNMEDLIHDQVRARKFLNEILVEAGETVDFKADSGSMSVALTGLPDGSVSITINKDKPENALAQLMAKCKDALGDVDKDKSEDDEKDPYDGVVVDTLAPRFDGRQNISTLDQKEATELLENLPDDKPVMLPVIAVMDDLEKCIGLCRELAPTNMDAPSDLYKYEGRYYLSMRLTDTKETLASSAFSIVEFCQEIVNQKRMLLFLSEHAEAIIRDNAIQKLSQL
ncbi:adaptor protein MecA [Candidatus Weimeria sp. HCP3S3_B5]|uniref:adaptor protein MecA n=1 Tax=Candidatus Weimeria sp. HCP3S3_B5 TaxID=3438871 RepID=UPI003F899CBA